MAALWWMPITTTNLAMSAVPLVIIQSFADGRQLVITLKSRHRTTKLCGANEAPCISFYLVRNQKLKYSAKYKKIA